MSSPVALVTGGGTGIGAAIARSLTAGGWNVAVAGRRSGPLEEIAAETGAEPIAADVANEEGARRAVAATADRFGRLDGVVLNAGSGGSGSLRDVDPGTFEQVHRTNVLSALLVGRAALPYLLESRGAFVTVASVAGLRAAPASLAYCSSKAALIMLTKCFALDHGADGVRANCVCPGWTRTDQADRAMDELGEMLDLDRESAYAEATRFVPLQRPADAAETAGLVRWLLSPEASYVNGAVIPIDGGSVVVDVASTSFGELAR